MPDDKDKLKPLMDANPGLAKLFDGVDLSKKKVFVQEPGENITDFLRDNPVGE